MNHHRTTELQLDVDYYLPGSQVPVRINAVYNHTENWNLYEVHFEFVPYGRTATGCYGEKVHWEVLQ